MPQAVQGVLEVDHQPISGAEVALLDELTPHVLIGVPASAVQALTLDGTGPAQRANYHKARVAEPRIPLRVQPGSWDLKVSHIVERGKPMRAAPPNWLGSSASLPDGRVVEADLGRMRIDIARDLAVRVAMRTVAD